MSRRDLLALAAVPLIVLLVDAFYSRQEVELSVQSQLNLRFAARPWDAALERYPRLRPPLYPALLWAAARAGIPVERVNEMILLGLLGGLALYFRASLPTVHVAFPLLAFAAAHPHYVNLRQYTAEALLVASLPALVFFLWRYLRSGGGWDLMATSFCLAVLCLSRYFALYFAFPLVLANVLAFSPAERRRRLLHAGALLVVAGLPVALWMYATWLQTGFWTGTDRSAPRQLPEAVRQWAELTSLHANLWLSAKTVVIDSFSPRAYAAHSVVTQPYTPSPVEWIGLGLVGACLAAGGRVWRDRRAWAPRAGTFLVAEFLAAYLVVTIVVWTVGNNDPLYTRFLYPAYPLLGILAFQAYAAVKAGAPSPWPRLPFILLYALFVVVQCARSWRAEALPVRYFT